ncbi:MAG: serine hydrolase domain-containing protein [Pseudomonadota bacterium]
MRWLAALAVLMASAAQADDAAMTRLDTAFGTWLDAHDVKGVMAVRHKGVLLGVIEHGLSADEPVELASVSKSITGLCALSLVQDGRLDWDDTVSARVGKGPDVTLAQLLTHSAGLGPDSTQMAMFLWRDQPPHRSADVLDQVLERSEQSAEVGTFSYNNENYALIGLMIEEASGAPYAETCTKRVLDPAGVEGGAAAASGAFMPWGGWAMRVNDYAALHEHWFGRDGVVGADPFAFPHVEAWDAYYGLGTMFRQSFDGSGYHFWHFGALCFADDGSIGAYAVSWFGDWSLLAAYDDCILDDTLIELDNALARAGLDLE